MTEKLSLYKCNVCGNVVQVILSGGGELVCCGKPMALLEPKNNSDEMLEEKHVPCYMHDKNKKYIQVGSTVHPMTEEHYIQFVEAFSQDKNKLTLQYFSPDEKPIMNLDESLDQNCNSLAYCNIHGLWEGKHD